MSEDRLNPYAKFIDRESHVDLVDSLLGATSALRRLITGVSPIVLTTTATPGKWSVRDILCHLADCEIVFAFRLRQAAAEPHHIVQTFDQDAWAQPSARLDALHALETFDAVRQWNVAFIRAVGPDLRTKLLTHPERGTMTFQHLIETMAGHDVNHRWQIERILTNPKDAAAQ
jgi:uncharacterized damage-inducible protein DinB